MKVEKCPYCKKSPITQDGQTTCVTADCPNDLEIPVAEWNYRLGHRHCEPFFIEPGDALKVIIISNEGKTAEVMLDQDTLPTVKKYFEAVHEAMN